MSKSLQDQFIDDDEEETCPLCVEEFDLTDKGFRPCECGYQICQFCYHNVKNNMNGLCPACRRPYDDAKIQYKVITPEETAAHRARQAQKAKKSQAAAQKEKAKAEADNMSRKHLAGLRVVQKNLVYVTGLSPTMQEDQLLQTLRGDQYFGQYGKIIKIVVSKAKDPSNPHSVGVYVTYERKEDAHGCIQAVDGSKNGDRTLRAQFGTTKYCSSYLRGETCLNRNCMFLHEPGEAGESYSRAELSAHNAGSSQHGGRSAPPQSQQPVASAAPPMARQSSNDQAPHSPTDDRPALPSTASWASKPILPGRAESRAASVAASSPAISNAVLTSVNNETASTTPAPTRAEPAVPKSTPAATRPKSPCLWIEYFKDFDLDALKFNFSLASLSEVDRRIIESYPPLFDHKGPARRRIRREREEEQRRMEQEAQAFQQPPPVDGADDDPEMSGSLQLGGEPDQRQTLNQMQGAIHPPGSEGGLDRNFQFGDSTNERAGLTQQQLLLQTLKTNTPQSGYANNSSQNLGFPSSFQSPAATGHQRNASRYSFANDTASASTAVKPVANAKLMNQQSAMMPSATNSAFSGGQQAPSQFYTSNVQGPPPGLKTTGTPPVSGNLTFGQGHGFATGGLQYGTGNRSPQDRFYQDLMRGGGRENTPADAKHDSEFPPLVAPPRTRTHSIAASFDESSRRSTPPVPPGFETQHQLPPSRRSTPAIPPGLSRPTGLPDLEGGGSRPSSRASLRRGVSAQILPALPLRPATPGQAPATPSKLETRETLVDDTPTKIPRGAAASGSELKVVQPGKIDEVAQARARDESADAAALTPAKETEKSAEQAIAVQADKTSEKKGMKPESDPSMPCEPATPSKPGSNSQDAQQKRKHPGRLDITAAVLQPDPPVQEKQAVSTPVDVATPVKLQRSVAQTPSAASAKPLDSPSGSISSPVFKTAPRTLRVVQTPKTETPVATVAPSLPSVLASKFPSRQPSVASINVPGTPTSEQVSIADNMSMASTTQSRASSPPPQPFVSKVGSAPVRTKTKSQQKKERQERAKALEQQELSKEEDKQQPEVPAQEAIVGRKKKAKKEKEVKPKAKPAGVDAQSVDNQPASPGAKLDESTKADAVPKPDTPRKTPPALQTTALPSPREPSPPPSPAQLTAAQLIADLKAHTPEIQKCIDSLFKVTTGSQFKSPQHMTAKDLAHAAHWKADWKVHLTKADVDALLSGALPAVHYKDSSDAVWDRGMITSSGAHLRALTKELESRFLELQKALYDLPEEYRFRPSKPQNEMKFPHVDLVALQKQFENGGIATSAPNARRGANAMEQMVQEGAGAGGMRKGAFLVDDAARYIDEFVMPPVTPPPNMTANLNGGQRGHANGQYQQQQYQQQQAQQQHVEGGYPLQQIQVDLEVAERQLAEAKRHAEEKELALKKQMKKNKRVLGIAT